MASPQCEDARQADLPQTQKSELILMYWPAGNHDRGASTSGINCLIVLLKRIYAATLDPPIFNSMRNEMNDLKKMMMEADNPFMAHAWLVLGPMPKDVGTALNNLTIQVWGKTLENIALEDLQFKNLASQARMQTTLWSMKQFTPVLEHLWSHQHTHQWHRLQEEATPTEVKDYFRKWNPTPTPGSIRLDAFPGMSLDVEVNKLFGEFSVGNFTVLVRPDAPVIFNVTFTVKGVGEKKLDFDAFRCFNLEVGKFIEVDGTIQQPGRPRRENYSLIALVKHRNSADDCDTIRIYDFAGYHRTPDGDLPEYATPGWRMADMKNGDTFLAVFGYSSMPPKSDPPFPEVAIKRDLTKYNEDFNKLTGFINRG